jgi:hypothetical protein
VSGIGQAIQVDRGRSVIIIDNNIQLTVVIEICYGNAPTVPGVITSGSRGNVDKLPVAKIRKQTLSLSSIPGVLRNESFAEEKARFVVIEPCDRTADEG